MGKLACLGMLIGVSLSAGPFLQAVQPPTTQASQPLRTNVRLLYSFEEGSDGLPIPGLLKEAERIDIVTVLDNGVTEGRQCARVTVPRGGQTGFFFLSPDKIAGWGDFDYLAIDLYTVDDEPYQFIVELWDAASANGEYHSRCTFERISTHSGRQTLLYPIDHPVRNGKQEWAEAQRTAADTVDRNALTKVKIFVTSRQDRDAVFWIDNIRLMQEDAARPKMQVQLPDGTIGFKFGRPADAIAGFQTVAPGMAPPSPGAGGFKALQGLAAGGEGWPDPLTGTFVWSPGSAPLEFNAPVPNGRYIAWVAAGKVIRSDLAANQYELAVNDQSFCDETPSPAEMASEKYLYRFLWTQYSQRPHALWRDFITRMYPVHVRTIAVTGGSLRILARNHFLAALILVPADRQSAFDQMAAAIENARIEAFERTFYAPARNKPQTRPAGPAFVVFVPEAWRDVMPWTEPTVARTKEVVLDSAGTPGQRVVMRLAVMPLADLGRCSLQPADLVGPGTIPATAIRGFFRNYRQEGRSIDEMALLPSLDLEMEAGVTQCYWLWMKVPDDARPGVYAATFTFRTGSGQTARIPVKFEVYPFKLEPVLPVSFAMYFRNARQWPPFAPGKQRQRLKEQFEWMRQIGFTAAEVDVPKITSLGPQDRVRMEIDATRYELAREVGMARAPEQMMLAVWLQVGRQVGRLLSGMNEKIDRDPGLELRRPEFAGYYLDACRQYREFLRKMDIPVALEVVDEPREVPNPWNRNLADTIRYSDLLRRVDGLTLYVSPMRDEDGRKDYTSLVDHFDILSLHSYDKSAGIMRKTLRTPGKRLWLYNSGKDRFSWGFYVWRAGATGRWEWNFCWPEDRAVGGYPGREWYTPFTELDGLAPYAPEDQYPGGMLFKSCYLDIAEGINDYAYLYTLTRALETAEKAGRSLTVVAQARAFLDGLRREMPEFLPYGNGAEAQKALQTGQGLPAGARKMDEWRRMIAEYLKQLQPS